MLSSRKSYAVFDFCIKRDRDTKNNAITLDDESRITRQSMTMMEEHRSDNRLKGSVRYSRVIPLGGMRTLQLEWTEDFYLGSKTAEEVTFSIEARMRRVLQEAGVVK
jgi:hypothetical protein